VISFQAAEPRSFLRSRSRLRWRHALFAALFRAAGAIELAGSRQQPDRAYH